MKDTPSAHIRSERGRRLPWQPWATEMRTYRRWGDGARELSSNTVHKAPSDKEGRGGKSLEYDEGASIVTQTILNSGVQDGDWLIDATYSCPLPPPSPYGSFRNTICSVPEQTQIASKWLA